MLYTDHDQTVRWGSRPSSIAAYEGLTALAAVAIDHMPVPQDDLEAHPSAA